MSQPAEFEPRSSAEGVRRWLIGCFVALAVVIAVTGVGLWWVVDRGWEGPSREEMLAELAANGESLNIEELAPGPVADADNVAVALGPVFAGVMELADARETGDGQAEAWKTWRNARTAADMREALAVMPAELAALLDAHAGLLADADAALRRPACRYDVDYRSAVEMELPHIQPARELARLYGLRAALAAAGGEADAAAADCARMVRLAHTFHGEPILISQMVRGGIDAAAAGTAELVCTVAEPSPGALRTLADAFDAEAAGLDLAHALRGERAMFHRELERLPEHADMGPAWGASILGPWLQRAWERDYLYYMGRLVDAAERPYADAVRIAREVEAEVGPETASPFAVGSIFSAMAVPSLARALTTHARTVAQLRAAATGCRVYAGVLEGAPVPNSVAHLPAPARVDPFTQQDLRVERKDGYLRVFSVGPDATDSNDDVVFEIPRRSEV